MRHRPILLAAFSTALLLPITGCAGPTVTTADQAYFDANAANASAYNAAVQQFTLSTLTADDLAAIKSWTQAQASQATALSDWSHNQSATPTTTPTTAPGN